MGDLRQLEIKLGYEFNDISMLRRALMHSSYVNEKGMERVESNERLEFLGDAVLEMIISQLLYHHSPPMTEGGMTKLRAKLVCEQSLSTHARELRLGSYLQLGRGEENGGGRDRPSILADALEAVIAAIFLDGGMEPAMIFIRQIFTPGIIKPARGSTDYKTILQEYIQDRPGMSYKYILTGEQGPDHNKTFTVELNINGKPKTTGIGKSKKAAEQAAAKEAIYILKGE